MENLILDAGARAPEVKFLAADGQLLLAGRSIPDNALELYSPMLAWLDKYLKQPAQHTQVDFRLIYFNSSSAEYILEMLRRLEELNQNGHTVNVNWFFEPDDEDMQQIGEDFTTMVKLPFHLVKLPPPPPSEDESTRPEPFVI